MNKIRLMTGCLVALMSLSLSGAIGKYDKSGCRLGEWTLDTTAAQSVAKENNSFIIVCLLKNDGSCGICNSVAENVLETSKFKTWAKEHKTPLLIADYVTTSSAASKYDGAEYESFPVIILIDGKDGKTRLAWFYTSNVQTGNGTSTSAYPQSGYNISSDFYEPFNYFLTRRNNSPYNEKANTGSAHKNSSAQAEVIVHDAIETAEENLKVNTIMDLGYVPNLLNRTWNLNTKTIKAIASDQYDWWKFNNETAGASYRLKAKTLDDALDIGRVCVFTNLVHAQTAKSYAAAMENAYAHCNLSELKDGWTFDAPLAGDVYILFTRRDAAEREKLDVKYTFTLQQANSVTYSLSRQQHAEDEGKVLSIDVNRSVSKGAGSVTFTTGEISALTSDFLKKFAENCNEAQEYTDYVFLNADGSMNADHVVTFADGVSSATIRVAFARGQEGIQSPDRAFTLKLDSDNAPEPDVGYLDAVVRIYDADREEDPQGDVALNATDKLTGTTGFLNFNSETLEEDLEDVYVLTNAPTARSTENGSVYYISVDPRTIHDFKDGKFTARAYRRIGPGEKDLVEIPPFRGKNELTTGDFTLFVFGVDSKDGWYDAEKGLPEVVLEVKRAPKSIGESPTVRYDVQIRRFDRPVVAFKAGEKTYSYAAEDLPASPIFELTADSVEAITNLVGEFTMDVGWKTVLPAEYPAESGDYTAADATCVFACDTNAVSVALLAQDKLSWPTRTVDVQLQQADSKTRLYTLGADTATVEFLADNVLPAPAVTLDISKSGWQSTGDAVRNLNYTNVVDEIVVTNVQVGAYYRLRADDVLAKPAGAETNVTVDVYTNENAIACSYALADLIFDEEAQAPILSFDALPTNMVTLRVSRSADPTVRVEYKLSLRKWEKPVIRFGEIAVTNDDTTASFAIPVIREGNIADAIEAKVVATNLTLAAEDDYYSVPATVSFAADQTASAVTVTVTDRAWNERVWTGDRSFKLTLDEIFPVGAFDFADGSNAVTVVLKETNGTGLDAADPKDDVRANVAAAGEDIAIAADGTLTNLVRMLNGRLDGAYSVSDTNDWFRFSGIVSNETYCFKVSDLSASNAEATASFFIGKSETAFTNLTLNALAEDGYRYNALTNADVFVLVSRAPDASNVTTSVTYALEAYRYVWPVVGFTCGTLVVTNTQLSGGIPLEIEKRFNTNETVRVSVGVNGRADGWEGELGNLFSGIAPESLTFGLDACATNVVTVGLAGVKDDVWTGDWSFNVWLDVDREKVHCGITNVTVTLVDERVPQLDEGRDPADDVKAGAVCVGLEGGSLAVTNHLNGIDAPHGGRPVCSDTNDWICITGVAAETTCRLTLDDVVGHMTEGLDLSVDVRSSEIETNVSFAALLEGCLDVPCPTAQDIFVRVARSSAGREIPVSVKYVLKAASVDWPRFALAAPAEVTNDCGQVSVTVSRADNLEGADMVCVRLSDTNGVKVVSGDLVKDAVFAPGATSCDVSFDIVANVPGFWKRGGAFEVLLERADVCPYVTLGDPTNLTVRVKDASGIPENDYAADDFESGAQSCTMDVLEQRATNCFDKAEYAGPYVWLNGNDTNDWYRFGGVKSGYRYRFAVPVLEASVSPVDATITVWQNGEALWSTNLFAKAEDGGPLVKDFVSGSDADYLVCVSRVPETSRDVSVRYCLSYRMLSPSSVEFVEAEKSVAESAEAVYVDVRLVVENDDPLESKTVITLTPTNDLPPRVSAEPMTDFDPTPIDIVWEAGVSGGVQRVKVPLRNVVARWEGDRSFLLALSEKEGETEVSDVGRVMRVVLKETDAPVYGTVGITAAGKAGEPLAKASASAVQAVKEGEDICIEVTRVNGQAGGVQGVFKWMNGKTQVGTTETCRLFEGVSAAEPTTTVVTLKVPTVSGFQAARTLTLNFSVEPDKAKTVGLTKGTPTALKYSVTDETYADKVAAYSAGDATKPTFRATGTAWYLSADGSLASSTPSAGGQVVMSTTVTGPGVLKFKATFADADKCTLVCKAGANTTDFTATASTDSVPMSVAVAAGSQTVTFTFKRPKTGASASARVAVSELVFEPDAGLFRTIGTFSGLVEIGGEPGLGTLSVTAAGKVSGKFVLPSGTLSFSSRDGWDGNTMSVVAKRGSKSVPATLTVDPLTGVVTVANEDDASGRLVRNCWGDKPLRADEASLLAETAGYYTVVLPEVDAGDVPLASPTFGSGYLMVTVNANGSVKAVGVLADGQSISLSGALQKDDGRAFACFYSSPSAYRKGWFSLKVALDGSAVGTVVTKAAGITASSWVSKAAVAPFERQLGVVGGFYDKTENFYEYYEDKKLSIGAVEGVSSSVIAGKSVEAAVWAAKDEEHAVSLEFSETGAKLTPSCAGGTLLTLSFTRKTGLFSGSFRAQYDYTYGKRELTTTKSFAYRGLLTPVRATADDVEGRGFFLMSEKDEQGRSVRRSYDLTIRSETEAEK